ncbi:MAG: D-tyrosyl-tRNA(Tyr) deacylase [Bacteroidetes bacterium]|nr:D-tyrosyl-tRNA(Tyr) deacylase [Bacteroidota bacterium]MBP9880078.1 D-tyrosyl-tRNA(Tyr) deacylase [Chitinophagales bacterium]
MRVVIQRVLNASVVIEQKTHASIGKGLMILLGVEENDSIEDITWLTQKIAQLRIFEDENGLMNISVLDIAGEILVVSQFTLYASTKKGNRPSFIRSAKPDIAIPLYEQFVTTLSQLINKPVATGVFGADMQVQLINDGPVTIIIDSKAKE